MFMTGNLLEMLKTELFWLFISFIQITLIQKLNLIILTQKYEGQTEVSEKFITAFIWIHAIAYQTGRGEIDKFSYSHIANFLSKHVWPELRNLGKDQILKK